ncbi:uncharacterized protein LOC135503184, partial [Lineus longissimus]|uniref:uncharacterized protein LOC135503184 n=1 Tax=Lineus longissimus TaxID=88925 RepID=UPI00315D561F
SGGQSSSVGPLARLLPNGDSTRYVAREVTDSLNTLLGAVLSESSRQGYCRAWSIYVQFCHRSLPGQPLAPLSVTNCSLFVAYLFSQKYAPATIASYLSAVCFFMKWGGYPDPSASFIVRKLLGAAQNLQARADLRLPITKSILATLLASIPRVYSVQYQQRLVAAMFSTAFHAFLRIGELVPKSAQATASCLQFSDVSTTNSEVLISILRFKSSKAQGPQCIHIQASLPPCPVSTLTRFMAVRGPIAGPLFLSESGRPVIRREFDLILKTMLNFCGLDSSRFKGHSFRIGAASDAAMQGKSDAQIRLLGRWSSDAFRRYIRIN